MHVRYGENPSSAFWDIVYLWSLTGWGNLKDKKTDMVAFAMHIKAHHMADDAFFKKIVYNW